MLSFIYKRFMLLVSSFILLTLFAYTAEMRLFDTDEMATYAEFLMRIFQGDLGVSSVTGEAVTDAIIRYYPPTLTLCFSAIVMALFIGITFGIIAALNNKKHTGFFIILLSYLGYSVPIYWLSMLLIKWFSLDLGWFPASSELSLIYDPPQATGFTLIDTLVWNSPYNTVAFQNALIHLVLPVMALAITPATEIIRSVRNHLLFVFRQNYIKTALARGKSKYHVALTHGLRNILPKIFIILGFQIGNIITGAIMVEIIFDWPGLGTWLINSIFLQDYTSIIGGVLMITGLIIAIHLIIEVLIFYFYPVYRKVLYETDN